MVILCSHHDPDGSLFEIIENNKDKLKNLPKVVIAHTKSTLRIQLSVLKGLGMDIVPGGLYGESRQHALRHAIRKYSDKKSFVWIDFDRLLHAVCYRGDEFNNFLDFKPVEAFTILGRTQKAIKTYPDSWQKTERIVNDLLSELIDVESDYLIGGFIVTPQISQKLLDNMREKFWGSSIEPALIAKKLGFAIDSVLRDEFDWEDPDRYQKEIKLIGGIEAWTNKKYNSLKEWEKRTAIMLEHIKVMSRLSLEI